MRSTGSSNCSQPSSSTRLLRGLSDSANTLLDVGLLILAQRQADDVDVVVLDGAHHGRAPAAADVQQRHARLEAEFAQRQIDLGDLRLFERHVVALEVRAAVGLRRVEEQPEEVVGQVVVRLHVLEVRLQVLACRVWLLARLRPLAVGLGLDPKAPRVSRASPVVRGVYAQYPR